MHTDGLVVKCMSFRKQTDCSSMINGSMQGHSQHDITNA